MPFNIGPLELIALLAIGVMLFGPEKLPSALANVAKTLRQFREFTRNAQDDLKKELGPEFQDFDLADLNPKNFVRKNLLGDGMTGDDMGLRELKDITNSLNGEIRAAGTGTNSYGEDAVSDVPQARSAGSRLPTGERPPYDADAT